MINREIPFRPRLEGEFRVRFYNAGTNKQSIAALIADGDELEKRIKRVHTGEMYDMLALEASSHPVNCLKILGTSAGMLYPPDQMHPNKRFVLSQDILEMILRSTVSPDEVLSGNDMRNRLWERFGIIIGGSTYEIEKLQSSGMLLQIDEDSLERNFTSFAALLESMDFAEVMADGILQIRLGGSD